MKNYITIDGGTTNTKISIVSDGKIVDTLKTKSISDIEKATITSKTPVLTDIVPNGNKTVIELYKAGGIPALMKVVCNAKGAVTSLDVGKEIEDKGWKMIC